MKQQLWRPVAFGIVVFLILGGSWLPSAEATHINCGDILGPGGIFFLDSNVGPCGTGVALIVVSSSLFMNGFTVSCASFSSNGIGLFGSGAQLVGGRVTGCGGGDGLLDNGGHTVQAVTADRNGDGFDILSDNNQLRGNTASNSDCNGFFFDVGVNQNSVMGNRATDSDCAGFDIMGDHGQFYTNVATNNEDEGFEVAKIVPRGITRGKGWEGRRVCAG